MTSAGVTAENSRNTQPKLKLVMNGASRSMQSFNSQVGTGSREHCFTGVCRTSWAVSASLTGVNDTSSDPERLISQDRLPAPSVISIMLYRTSSRSRLVSRIVSRNGRGMWHWFVKTKYSVNFLPSLSGIRCVIHNLTLFNSDARHSVVDAALWTEKLNFLNKQCFYRDAVQCQKLQQLFKVQSFGLDTGPHSSCHSFIALSIIRCLKSAQKFAIRMREVATVVMETTQLVLSQLKTFTVFYS